MNLTNAWCPLILHEILHGIGSVLKLFRINFRGKGVQTMYEIIANPQEYQIDHLINGIDNANIELTREERDKWAKQIVQFSERLSGFAQKTDMFSSLLASEEKISAPPASLKTLKIKLFIRITSYNVCYTKLLRTADSKSNL